VITAVDTSVLLDFLGRDPRFGPGSREALRTSASTGRLVACEAVWAEATATFASADAAAAVLNRLGIEFSPLDAAAALAAGSAWRAYRKHGGKRQRLLADFLIGAHALKQADRLLTRDRGFYRKYFRGLRILDPSAS